jgi:hypothetical protein
MSAPPTPVEHVGELHITPDRGAVYATCTDGWRGHEWGTHGDGDPGRQGRAIDHAIAEFATHADETPDPSGMPVFPIKAKDALAPEAVQAYRALCARHGLDDMVAQVDLALVELDAWQAAHPNDVRLPSHRHVPTPPRPVTPGGDRPHG